MIRFGLCCIFREAPIRFRRVTAKHLLSKPPAERLTTLSAICRHNAEALHQALLFCQANGIGGFRINSQILPLKTHPEVGYAMADLPGGDEIVDQFRRCGRFSRRHHIRTSFHPDQFIVLNSPNPDVVHRSMADLAYQTEVARWVNADVINLHGGGAYGDKKAALRRLVRVIGKLPTAVRNRLSLENDDRVFTPADLLPVCRQAGVPLVYDVHHHRCLPDGRTVADVTGEALETWPREPLFHLSSPLHRNGGGPCGPHHDFIDPSDFPCEWRTLDLTVEIEAKAKEIAILRLMQTLPDDLKHRCA